MVGGASKGSWKGKDAPWGGNKWNIGKGKGNKFGANMWDENPDEGDWNEAKGGQLHEHEEDPEPLPVRQEGLACKRAEGQLRFLEGVHAEDDRPEILGA